MPFSCPGCGRTFKSTRGLGIHASKCKPRPRIRYPSVESHDDHTSPKDLTATTRSQNSVVPPLGLNARHLPPDTPHDEPSTVTLDDVPKHQASAHNASTSAPSSSLGRRLLLQTTRSLDYTDERARSVEHPRAGRPAGTRLNRRPHYTKPIFENVLCRALDDGKSANFQACHFSPFANEAEFRFAMHIRKFRNSQAEIDAFIKNPDLPFGGTDSRIKNPQMLYRTIMDIPYGIEDDQWEAESFNVTRPGSQSSSVRHTVFKRDIEQAVRFLIGFRPFRDQTRYVPVQDFDERGERLYSDFMTADWAWHTQDRLRDGATLIPIKIYSDKTLLTNVVGEQAFYPVGIQILNHSNELLNRVDVPNFLTVGFIPIVAGSEQRMAVKSEVYHLSMSKIFGPLVKLAEEGVPMLCADGFYRHCHPVIGGISADLEEQFLITGNKKNRQCTICTVPFQCMERLYGESWPRRSHTTTVSQHQAQRERPPKRPRYAASSAVQDLHANEATHVHLHWNYLWDHPYTDTHDVIMPDPLHQLDKGIVHNVIQWLQLAEPASNTAGARNNSQQSQMRESHTQYLARLNECFRSVPPFTGIRTFSDFSGITKWQGGFARSVLRQLPPVMVSLFGDQKPERIMFVNALVNIVFILRSKSISESMLFYLTDELFVLDLMKHTWDFARLAQKSLRKQQSHQEISLPRLSTTASQRSRLVRAFAPDDDSASESGDTTASAEERVVDDESSCTESSESTVTDDEDDLLDEGASESTIKHPTYNIPKWHLLTHYLEWIRSKGSPQSGDTSRGEVEHKDLKTFYRRTNKHGDWEDQICGHIQRAHRLLAMEAYWKWLQLRIKERKIPNSLIADQEDLKITKPSKALVDLNALKIPFKFPAPDGGLPSQQWRRAACLRDGLNLPVFTRAVATIVRNERARRSNIKLSDWELERLVLGDTSWADGVWTALHNSLVCFRQTAKTASRVGSEEKELVYCSYRWRKEAKRERRDCVWVQDHPESGDCDSEAAQSPNSPPSYNVNSSSTATAISMLNGRRIGRLVAILTVLDPELTDSKDRPIRHHGAILDMFDYESGAVYNPTHRMIRLSQTGRPRYQVWSVDLILRSAHVVRIANVSNNNSHIQRFVVNYASDWNSWMSLAPDNFLEVNYKSAMAAFRKNVAAKRWGNRPNFHTPRYQPPPSWVIDSGQAPPSLINQVLASS